MVSRAAARAVALPLSAKTRLARAVFWGFTALLAAAVCLGGMLGAARGEEEPQSASPGVDAPKANPATLPPAPSRPIAPPAKEAAAAPADLEVHARALELIVQLGDEHFSRREAATQALVHLGLGAVPALREGSQNTDREVRYRCERILALVAQFDREQRMAAFLAGRDQLAGELPLWTPLKNKLGDSGPVRAMYIEMLKSEWPLLETIDRDRSLATELISQRLDELQNASQQFQQQVSIGSVSTMLFVAGVLEDVNVPDHQGAQLYNLCYQQSFRSAIMAGARRDALRRLLGAWVERATGMWTAYQSLNLAMQYDLEEGVTAAERVLDGDAGIPPHIKQFAILAIAKLGNESHLPLLEKQLGDNTHFSTHQAGSEIYHAQLRDLALASMVHLAKQDLKQFGFPRVQTNPQMVFNPSTVGFKDDAERDAARKKWDAFRAGKEPAEKANDASDAEAAKEHDTSIELPPMLEAAPVVKRIDWNDDMEGLEVEEAVIEIFSDEN